MLFNLIFIRNSIQLHKISIKIIFLLRQCPKQLVRLHDVVGRPSLRNGVMCPVSTVVLVKVPSSHKKKTRTLEAKFYSQLPVGDGVVQGEKWCYANTATVISASFYLLQCVWPLKLNSTLWPRLALRTSTTTLDSIGLHQKQHFVKFIVQLVSWDSRLLGTSP